MSSKESMFPSDSIEIINNDIDPKEFFTRFIVTRKPVIINGHLRDETWQGHKWIDYDYLAEKCGAMDVKIERRESSSDSFGQGKEESMPFSEFLSRIRQGDSSLYMTTQELLYTPEGKPTIMAQSVTKLCDDFPLKPSLLGNLVLQNANLWIGCSSKDAPEATSGLHHDYHDNLYILLRGKKRFVLFPPQEAENLYTVGELDRVHPNGRINYVGQPTLADGSAISSLAAVSASKAMIEAAQRLDEKKRLQEKDADDGSYDCEDSASDEDEEALEAALEAALDAEMDDQADDDDDDDDDDAEEEGEDDENEDESSEYEDEDADEDADEDDSESDRACNEKQQQTASGKRKVEADQNKSLPKKAKFSDSVSATSKGPPSNFSRVATTALPKQPKQRKAREYELKEKFPRYWDSARQRGASVVLKTGQMLYLPAGWFHEVFSSSDMAPGPATDLTYIKETSNHQADSEDRSHMAFNYWCHPPDGNSFEKPYSTSFWADDWESRLQEGLI